MGEGREVVVHKSPDSIGCASVAQLVEQLTLNQLVLGSSPSRGTNFAEEIVSQSPADTLLTRRRPESEAEPVNWPKREERPK